MASAPIQLSNEHPVDRLGEVKAQIAELKRVEAELAEQLKAMGNGAHDGYAYRATVSEVDAKSSVDPKAMEAKLKQLGVDGRWFAKNQKTRKGYTVIKVTARKA